MKALLETIGEMIWPKPNKWYSPTWKRSDYGALGILAFALAAVIGFWPQ